MIIPTVISTVASAMTIIKYMIEVGRHIMPDTTEALVETQREAARLSPDKPAKLVDDILYEKLQQHFPQSELQTMVTHLAQVMEVIQPVVTILAESHEKAILPKYGWALGQMISRAAVLLQSWGCFQSFGHTRPNEHYGRSELCLVLPNLAARLGASATIRNLGLDRMRDPGVYLMKNPHNDWGQLFALDDLAGWLAYRQVGVLYLTWGDYDARIYGGVAPGDSVDRSLPLRSAEFESLIVALLQDIADYSQRVRGAVHASQGLLDRLSKSLDSMSAN